MSLKGDIFISRVWLFFHSPTPTRQHFRLLRACFPPVMLRLPRVIEFLVVIFVLSIHLEFVQQRGLVDAFFVAPISSRGHSTQSTSLQRDRIAHSQLTAYLPDYDSTVDVGGVSKAITPPFEADVLGMLNFCLRNSDTALSGPSRSKILNDATNLVFKAIMIGFEPLVDETLLKLEAYKGMMKTAPCVLDPDERNAQRKREEIAARAAEAASAKAVMDSFSSPPEDPAAVASAVARRIESCETDLSTAYRYVDWLTDLLKTGGLHNNVILGGIYDRGYKRLLTLLKDLNCRFPKDVKERFRPVPADQNICLSLLDMKLPAGRTSKTRALNKWSNIAARCILYGGKHERTSIATFLEKHASEFAQTWTPNDPRSQESLYLRALALLLRENLAVAEVAITAQAPDAVSPEDAAAELALAIASSSASDPTAASTPLITAVSDPSNLRLFDTYQNAFHRVVEVCLTEIGKQDSPLMLQQSSRQNEDEILQNFLVWEQGLRRNLTMDLWNKNPTELTGRWELVDVAGTGSLKTLMTSAPEVFFEAIDGVNT